MIFVIVRFEGSRVVLVDGIPCGETNKLIEVEAGTHVFELEGHKNYVPVQLTVDLSYRSSLSPEEIIFKEK